MLTTLVATALFSIPLAQVEPPKPKPEPKKGEAKEAKTNKSSLRTWTDKEAKEKLKDFKEQTKGKASLQQKLQALELFREGRSSLLVKPLARLVKIDKKLTVRRTAAELLGNQPGKSARRSILSLLKDKRVRDEPAVMAALVRSFANEAYRSPNDWKEFDKMFKKLKSDPHKENAILEKSIVLLAGKTKEKESLRTLLNAMDAPEPVNVDDPSNPPAEYWERRWKNWEVWRADIRESVFQITGQRFSSRKEARKWLRKNAKKLGITKY